MSGICFYRWQEPHIGHEFVKQWRSVVLPPDQSERQRQSQICHWQQRHALGTAPTGGTADERHTQAARDEAENRRFIYPFLNDVRRFEAAAKTLVHQPVVVGRAFASRKPDKSSVVQIP